MQNTTDLDQRLAWFKRERGRLTITMSPENGWTVVIKLSKYADKATSETDFEAVCLWLSGAIGEYQAAVSEHHLGGGK